MNTVFPITKHKIRGSEGEMREQDAKRRIAETFAANSPRGAERNPDKLKHMLSTDIRDSIPPQIYELIAVVADRIRQNLEEK